MYPCGGHIIIPVAATDNDSRLANVFAAEAKAIAIDRTIGVDEGADVAGDAAVVADLVAREMSNIAAKSREAGVELFKDNGLSFNLANLLSDDPLCHFLKDNKLLLDNLNPLCVANKLMFLLDNNLARVEAIEVVGAVEIIETTQRRETSPVVERGVVVSSGS